MPASRRRLTHLNRSGEARMVDVSSKRKSVRIARAMASVRMSPASVRALIQGGLAKGDALGTARIAGIMAAKKTHDLIPLCHPLAITDVKVDIDVGDGGVEISTEVRTTDRTGVEMEALTAAAVASLTVYDMCKSIDKSIVIERIALVSKTGGKSGTWKRSG